MSLHFHPLRVREKRPDTDEGVVVSFDVPVELADTFRFTQGQYLTLRHEVDGQDIRRSYSICAGLDDGELRVGVRKVPGGVFSGWLHERLRVGDAIEVIPPQGRFFAPLDPRARRHYLGVAGGCGITPILSIMKTVLAREPHSRFTLVYGNRTSRSTMFKEELQDLKDRYLARLSLHHVFSREAPDTPLHSGRLTREKIAEFLESLVDPRGVAHAFVCGPYAVNDEVEAALLAGGVPAERIHIERFGVPPGAGTLPTEEARAGDAERAKVVIIRDGVRRELQFQRDDASILDAAVSAGLDLPYSCKSGVCCTCRARLLEGQVRMDRNFGLERREIEDGFVLTCQSHPLTERVLLSFDERQSVL
jgi:ring-1,2-phenylacetyl-CoA epoxidase subunit PaaE